MPPIWLQTYRKSSICILQTARDKPVRRGACLVFAAKGFGSKEQPNDQAIKGVATKSRKGKRVAVKQPNPIASSQPAPNSREEKFLRQLEKIKDGSNAEDQEFQKRLEALKRKANASQKQREDSAVYASPLNTGPLEAPKRESRASTDGSSGTSFGVPQVAIGALSLLLVGVFIVTSGYGPAGPTSQSQSQSNQISQKQAEAESAIKDQAEQLEKQLQERPDDLDAKQELSDLATALGDYRRARSLAEEVVKASPSNSRAWLVLAEAQTRLLDLKAAAQSYKKSLEFAKEPTLLQLQGLTGALAGDKKFEEAVQQLQRYESQAGKNEALGAVELQLLIGKVYSQWDRHFASSLAVYDGIIEKYPEDFRGYLAKGALLKENGRKADAQRMFIQARFYAPAEARAVVEQIANR